MGSEKCNFSFCSICPVDKCDVRKEDSKFEFRCDGNCYLCDRALHYHSVSAGTPFEGQFSLCKMYHYQTHHGFKFYARTGKRSTSSKIENEIYQYDKCKKCTFEHDAEKIKKILEVQEEKGWLPNIDQGELMQSLKMVVTLLQDFDKEKNCQVAIGIMDLIPVKGIKENKLISMLKKQYALPKCFFCSERSLKYFLDIFEKRNVIYKDEDKWYKFG